MQADGFTKFNNKVVKVLMASSKLQICEPIFSHNTHASSTFMARLGFEWLGAIICAENLVNINWLINLHKTDVFICRLLG